MLVGGVDISYPKWSDSLACGCLVVYSTHSKSLVYKDLIDVTVSVPYIPGFLAYREMDVYRQLLLNLRASHPEYVPQLLLVDGHGRLHPRHFGSACSLGLEVDIPTIGIGKNPFCGESFPRKILHSPLNHVEGIDVCLDTHQFKQHIAENIQNGRQIVELKNVLNVDLHPSQWRADRRRLLQAGKLEAHLRVRGKPAES